MTMYEGFVNSPPTTLTGDITDVATTIPVAELGVFPAAPNMATIGNGDDAETILYGAKSAASGAGNLTSVTREYNTTGTYGAKKAWVSGSIIARTFTEADLETLQSEITSLNADIASLRYENTVSISPTGGDYNTIQAALDANTDEYTLFLVYPGYYVDDTIHYTNDNQSVIGMDNSTTEIIGSAATNIVDFGAYVGCVLNRVTVRITGATTSVHTVTGSTGNIIINDCTLEMTNASYTGAVQPSVINITGAGTCEVKFGFINYTNNVVAAVIKSAILLGTGSFVRLRRGDMVINGAGASTGMTLALAATDGRVTATRSNITVTDAGTSNVVGFYLTGSATDDEITNCHIHVDGGTATGIWHAGTGTVRSFGNRISVTGTTAYSFQVGAGATVISVYDDIIAANGVTNAGTLTTVPTRQLNLAAFSGIQPTTDSVEVSITEMATNAFPLPYAIFKSGASRTVERLCWISNFESGWNSSNVTAQILATTPSTETHDVTWLLYAVRVPTAGFLTTALPLVATITTSHVTAYKTYSSAVTTPFAITGTGNTILWELKRGTVDDTMSVSAYFLNCKILYGVL